ncbi:MAG TPA: metallophosphoesterase, partial [Rhodopila sp.]|nr:metallophosphoesterase [Rhodopila sp.]
MTIVFIGDIHQQWDKVERGLAQLAEPPDAAIILGDVQCEQPLDMLAAPLLRAARAERPGAGGRLPDLAGTGDAAATRHCAAVAVAAATAYLVATSLPPKGPLRGE